MHGFAESDLNSFVVLLKNRLKSLSRLCSDNTVFKHLRNILGMIKAQDPSRNDKQAFDW